MRSAAGRTLGVVAVAFLSGCPPSSRDAAPEVFVSDSAGVVVVYLPPLTSLEATEWRVERLFSTSDVGGSSLDLFGVAGAVLVGDSTLVIANAGSSELVVIDRLRESVRRVGREGNGPGEFGLLRGLFTHPSGDLIAFDHRLSRFSPTGEFIGTQRVEDDNVVVDLHPLAVLEDGTVVSVTGDQRIFLAGGERRDTVPLLVFRPGARAADTIGTWPGLERAFAALRSGQLLVPIGFARTAFAASNGRSVAVGSTDSVDVTVYDEALDPTLRLIAPPDGRVPSRRAVDRWRQDLLERVPSGGPDARIAWSEAPVRDSYPGYDGLVVGADNRLWIGEYPEPGADSRRWIAFSPEGLPEGQIYLPLLRRRWLPGDTELLTVDRDQLVLLRTNDVDEETVEVWRVYPTR